MDSKIVDRQQSVELSAQNHWNKKLMTNRTKKLSSRVKKAKFSKEKIQNKPKK